MKTSSKKTTRASKAFGAALEAGKKEISSGSVDGRPSVTGAWASQATKGLTKELTETRDKADKMTELHYNGVLEGKIPVTISVQNIEDLLGSDRLSHTDETDDQEDSFKALVKNIRTRGQRVPIRVRPIDLDWKLNPDSPWDIEGQRFALQSGRRRLAACKEIGIDPICFISFTDSEAVVIDDLQERFFENSARKELTMIERLFSIGQIANELPGANQAQIAEIMGINRTTANRGIGVFTHYEELVKIMETATPSRDQIDVLLKSIREENREYSDEEEAVRSRHYRSKQSTVVKQAPLPFRHRETPVGDIFLSRKKNGNVQLKIEAVTFSEDLIDKIINLLNQEL